MTSGVSPERLEAVALALFYVDEPDRQWTDRYPIRVIKDSYRKRAAAAIEALGLREVFTWSWPETLTHHGEPGYGYEVPTADEARNEADTSYMTVVSEWVPVDGGQE